MQINFIFKFSLFSYYQVTASLEDKIINFLIIFPLHHSITKNNFKVVFIDLLL